MCQRIPYNVHVHIDELIKILKFSDFEMLRILFCFSLPGMDIDLTGFSFLVECQWCECNWDTRRSVLQHSK